MQKFLRDTDSKEVLIYNVTNTWNADDECDRLRKVHGKEFWWRPEPGKPKTTTWVQVYCEH